MGIFLLIVAVVVVAYLYMKKNNEYSEEVLRIIELADQGDSSAESKLADLFHSDKLTSDRHNELRRKIYYPKAVQGDPMGEYWMGFLTNMIDHDAEASLQWYTCAANHGNVEAMRDLSFRYSKYANEPDSGIVGFGTDYEREIYWLKMAADTGHCKSQFDMGSECKINNNYKDAIFWYNKAAQGDDFDVKFNAYKELADIYLGYRDKKFENREHARVLLEKILYIRKNYNQIPQDYECIYTSALNSYGCMHMQSFNEKHSKENLIDAVYCFTLIRLLGDDYVNNILKDLPYTPTALELKEWRMHAENFLFMPPFPDAEIRY